MEINILFNLYSNLTVYFIKAGHLKEAKKAFEEL